jgi:hypothetical protein
MVLVDQEIKQHKIDFVDELVCIYEESAFEPSEKGAGLSYEDDVYVYLERVIILFDVIAKEFWDEFLSYVEEELACCQYCNFGERWSIFLDNDKKEGIITIMDQYKQTEEVDMIYLPFDTQ